jgi:hypothetical protein
VSCHRCVPSLRTPLMSSTRHVARRGAPPPSPISQRHSMGTPPTPITTTPWPKDAPTPQTMMMVHRRLSHHGGPPDSLLSDRTPFGRGNECEPVLNKPTPSARRRNGEASKRSLQPSHMGHHDTSSQSRWRGS